MIRDYQTTDQPEVERIFREQGFDYQFPDLDSALFLVKKVREVDGKITDAMFLRISCETFLMCSGGPKDKMAAMKELQPEVLQAAWQQGIDDVYAVIPPEILARFQKRLKQLGWQRDRSWPMYSRKTGEQ